MILFRPPLILLALIDFIGAGINPGFQLFSQVPTVV